MKTLTIKKHDKSLDTPLYQTKGSVALDLYCAENIELEPKAMDFISLGISIKLPKDHVGLLVPRSSTYKKYGLLLANSVGVIDEDFCGNDDILKACFINAATEKVKINKGDRLCQLLIIPYTRCNIIETENLSDDSRGGFGSTGD